MPAIRVIVLFALATVVRWLRGKSWSELARGPASDAAIAAAAGAAALAVAVLAGGPLIEAVLARGVEWSQFPIVRGSATRMFGVASAVACLAIAAELALRGGIVETVLELAGSRVLAVAAGALGEALLVDGDLAVRAGGALLGIALGWMYVASGRNVVAPVCARLAFVLGALLLEALRLVS
ncbi:MAG: hypothetical protein ACM31C_25450 [Acidobacteriota bacterium]